MRLITAPTLIEGRVFAEVLQPTALLVDAEFAGDGQRSLLAAAAVGGAMPVVLGGQGDPSSGFVERVSAERAALGEWLKELRVVERPGTAWPIAWFDRPPLGSFRERHLLAGIRPNT